MAPKMEQFNSIPAIFATSTSKLKDFSIIYIRENFFLSFCFFDTIKRRGFISILNWNDIPKEMNVLKMKDLLKMDIVTCLEEQRTPPTESFDQHVWDWREQKGADSGSADRDPGGQCSPSFKIKSGSYHSRHVNQACPDTSWQCKIQRPRESNKW